MRDAKTQVVLDAVNAVARLARVAGCSQEAIVFEATAGAFADPDDGRWPGADAYRAARSASKAIAAGVPSKTEATNG